LSSKWQVLMHSGS